ncbi:Casein kinase II subunit beta-1 [Cytospora mali]|uniref:Casein kinase II subunit beta n=1 Tax=Cytospora mali TaxID=578113 RepID=A0A194VYW0_CYTMA|nr:Casein kinase II subunit beta-1 [Valsa mali]
MSTSSGPPESWIASFCSLLGHEYFAEVSEDFIEDDFNLTGLQSQVPMYKEALEMILDVEPEDDEDDEDEEDEDEEDVSADGLDRRLPGERRHHSRMASDLSVIESSAEMLYGLIHQRYICSRAGIQQMSEKYEMGHFGCCPRTNCNQARTLPVGLSDIPGEDTVKLFCPSCLDVYVPPNSRFQTVDGAFFGRTFGALFLLTFPDYDYSKHGAELLSSNSLHISRRSGDDDSMINGMHARNIAPGLGPGKIFEPRIYGFRVSELARSGPRMQWLRDKPANISELDEARRYAEENPDSDDDESMNGNSRQARRRPRGNARLRQRQQNGSPMAIDPNGAESEL